MKTATQIITCLLALGSLLAGAASHATNVAELPLKASVLAKPNVIWGLDDSGSMDSEVMINANDGAFWWNYDTANGWDAAGAPWFNSVGTSSSTWRKMVYLFPNGGGTGERAYTDASNDHFAIPPTAQFAFMRSPTYNPLYYNPAVTYKPWSPAYVAGAAATYSDATRTAVKSHPIVGTSSFDLTATRTAAATANTTFMALPGMTIPAGSKTCVHSACPTWTTEATARTVPAATILRLQMDYFPATYYLRETCTVDGTSCVSAPNGLSLKRYEIKSASYATTAAYDAAIKNFSNWFQYYRKRKLMLSAAIGQVLEPLTGLRMGVVQFNNLVTPTIYDIDSASPASNGQKVAGLFYETLGTGGTPTRETLDFIGNYFMGASSPVQYACQRNNTFIVTDGFANVATVTPPTYSPATWGAGAPYATTFPQSLADIALSYYTNNLKASFAAGRVPARTGDINTNLHLNTYGLTLGAKGTLFIDDTTPVPTSAAAWPEPLLSRNPTAVDDLWHATINGRGKMYLASTPEQTALKIQAGLSDILAAVGAQSGVAVSTVNLVRGDSRAYFGTYNPSGWQGDVTANAIDPATGAVSATAAWSASALLTARDWNTRVIASYNGTAGVGFTAAAVGATVNPASVYGTTSEVMSYLRGERTNEGSKFRLRSSLIGAVINSEPYISNEDGVLYVASGEGMLHAIDIRGTDAGKELWAFVPRTALADVGQTVKRGYAFKTQLDGSPAIGKISSGRRLLVAGTGAAARSFYAIDVTTPRGLTEATLAGKVKWEFPAASDTTTQAKVGQALGRPTIVRTADSGYVVLVSSGYNSTADGKGRLWMLNPDTGAIIYEFVTADGSLAAESGLTHVSAYAEGDGTVRYVYGGDLLGNVWRFDLKLMIAPDKIAVLKGPLGDLQPVTAQPELMKVDGNRVVIVPTGRLLDITDFGSSKVQSIYAIKDGGLLTNARTSLVPQVYNAGADTLTASPVNWATQRGWYMDLPAGQQGNTRPTIAFGAVAFVTNQNGGTDCSAASWLYLIDVKTGGKFSGADFVGAPISTTSNATSVTAVVTSDGLARGLVQDFDGGTGVPRSWRPPAIPPSKSAWREVKRQ